jgi:hypothetical protein
MNVAGWRSSYLGNDTKLRKDRRVFQVYWNHFGQVISAAYDKDGNLTELKDNG